MDVWSDWTVIAKTIGALDWYAHAETLSGDAADDAFHSAA